MTYPRFHHLSARVTILVPISVSAESSYPYACYCLDYWMIPEQMEAVGKKDKGEERSLRSEAIWRKKKGDKRTEKRDKI